MTTVSAPLVASFSRTYREAREKFLAAAVARRLAVESAVNPVGSGAEGEELAMDAALAGPAAAPSLLVLSSGTHGIEGFCGSGCRIALLKDDVLLRRLDELGVAILLVHAVNPWGFSQSARTNEDNVDLNRNFIDFADPPPPPIGSTIGGYEALHPLLVPVEWPPSAANEAELQRLLEAGGPEARRAMVGGQATHPDGLFWAGTAPTWSNRSIRALLRRHGAGRKRLAWLDLHSGLGPSGHGEKIFGTTTWGEQAAARALAWYGSDVVQSTSQRSITPRTEGYIGLAGPQECPQAEYTFMTLEFGTVPFAEATTALRGEAWLRNHSGAPAEVRTGIKQAVRRAFYVEEDFWKGQVVGQIRSVVLQAIHGLGGLA